MPRNMVWVVCFLCGCGVAAIPPVAGVDGDLAAQTARAVMLLRRTKPDDPKPAPDGECCKRCENGWITHGDGHKTPCPCPATCECKR